ncbi:hypothetical protein F4677DRAFT_462515 [Hypoxylon crocopeplum]|nr:hypothetical protein F4677DRAFT_462515 [Hypoxylon crocopeplum]
MWGFIKTYFKPLADSPAGPVGSNTGGSNVVIDEVPGVSNTAQVPHPASSIPEEGEAHNDTAGHGEPVVWSAPSPEPARRPSVRDIFTTFLRDSRDWVMDITQTGIYSLMGLAIASIIASAVVFSRMTRPMEVQKIAVTIWLGSSILLLLFMLAINNSRAARLAEWGPGRGNRFIDHYWVELGDVPAAPLPPAPAPGMPRPPQEAHLARAPAAATLSHVQQRTRAGASVVAGNSRCGTTTSAPSVDRPDMSISSTPDDSVIANEGMSPIDHEALGRAGDHTGEGDSKHNTTTETALPPRGGSHFPRSKTVNLLSSPASTGKEVANGYGSSEWVEEEESEEEDEDSYPSFPEAITPYTMGQLSPIAERSSEATMSPRELSPALPSPYGATPSPYGDYSSLYVPESPYPDSPSPRRPIPPSPGPSSS